MDFSSLIKYLNDSKVEYKTCVNTASLVSIKVGGIASIVIYPNTIECLCDLIKHIHLEYKYYLLGNGTNIYFCDYFDGVLISTKHLNNVQIIDSYIEAECGASLNRCAVYAYEKELSGFEFAYGIPGTVGGGIFMNASAFGGKVSDVIIDCLIYDTENKTVYTIQRSNMDFYEKHSVFMNKKYIILKARIKLYKSNADEIKSKMDLYMQKRIDSQPLNVPSAGSAFKRPKEGYASMLIDKLGLKGFRIGDAQISTKHAGFIINIGNATANEIKALIQFIELKIKKEFNIDLEEEILYVE